MELGIRAMSAEYNKLLENSAVFKDMTFIQTYQDHFYLNSSLQTFS